MTTPSRTWFDLARLMGLPDLVAAADHLLRHEYTTGQQLEEIVDRLANRRHVRTLRSALALVDPAAESRPESLVRVALVQARIPGLRANVPVYQDGQLLGRPDLLIAEHRVAIEYQGDYHRTEQGRWRKDIARLERFRAAGWRVIELTGDDLGRLDDVVRRVRLALLESQHR